MSDNIDIAPATQLELSRFVAENATGKRSPLMVSGGRTALHLRQEASPACVNISTADLTEVVDYPARDMTITVESGMRAEQLQQFLAQEGQQLPVDVSQINHATIGGAVATNSSGPRRFGYGTFRDYLIGVTAVDAAGSLFSAGGRVVKNVAGYDLCKLLVGSWGTLAIVTQLTFKLKPIPEQSMFLWINYSDWDAVESGLEKVLVTNTQPMVVELLNKQAAVTVAAEARIDVNTSQPVLALLLEGTIAEVEWQREQLQQELMPTQYTSMEVLLPEESEQLLDAMTNFSIYADAPATFTCSLPPSKVIEFVLLCQRENIAVMSHAANGIMLGVFPDSIIIPTQAADTLCLLRDFTLQYGGTFTLLECEKDWKQKLTASIFTEPEKWNQQLKQQLDPHNLLNPGHLF